jgi:hypothetical protein
MDDGNNGAPHFHFYGPSPSREKHLLVPSCPSTSSSAFINAAPTGQISVKYDIGDFYENMSEKRQIWLKSGKNIGHFT